MAAAAVAAAAAGRQLPAEIGSSLYMQQVSRDWRCSGIVTGECRWLAAATGWSDARRSNAYAPLFARQASCSSVTGRAANFIAT
jgi:hypothetical protein